MFAYYIFCCACERARARAPRFNTHVINVAARARDACVRVHPHTHTQQHTTVPSQFTHRQIIVRSQINPRINRSTSIMAGGDGVTSAPATAAVPPAPVYVRMYGNLLSQHHQQSLYITSRRAARPGRRCSCTRTWTTTTSTRVVRADG